LTTGDSVPRLRNAGLQVPHPTLEKRTNQSASSGAAFPCWNASVSVCGANYGRCGTAVLLEKQDAGNSRASAGNVLVSFLGYEATDDRMSRVLAQSDCTALRGQLENRSRVLEERIQDALLSERLVMAADRPTVQLHSPQRRRSLSLVVASRAPFASTPSIRVISEELYPEIFVLGEEIAWLSCRLRNRCGYGQLDSNTTVSLQQDNPR